MPPGKGKGKGKEKVQLVQQQQEQQQQEKQLVLQKAPQQPRQVLHVDIVEENN